MCSFFFLKFKKLPLKMKTHRDLTVYVKSLDLTTEIYKVSNSFPSHEIFGLTSQIRRASSSIPVNIAEGSGRNHLKENIQFLYISRASGTELETLLEISRRLDYLNSSTHQSLFELLNEVLKMLNGLINNLKQKL